MRPSLATWTVTEVPPATTECCSDATPAVENGIRDLLQRIRVNQQRAAVLAGRSMRAIHNARDLLVTACERLAITERFQRARGKRWYRFVRITGGSSSIDELIAVSFTLPGHLAKEASRVSLLAPFNQWKPDVHRLTRTPEGDWSITIHLPPGRVIYHYDVDGAYWLDPNDEARVPNAWGSEYSVRNVRTIYTQSPDRRLPNALAPVRGGAQVLESPLVSSAETAAFRGTGEAARGAISPGRYRRPAASRNGSPFGYRTEERLGASLLHVTGEVDASTAPEFEDALMQAIAAGQPVVVWLGAIRYLDSSALGCLIRARSRLANRNQRLILAEPSPQVRRVIEIAGFNKAFPLFSTVEAAMRYLAGVAHDDSVRGAKGPARPAPRGK